MFATVRENLARSGRLFEAGDRPATPESSQASPRHSSVVWISASLLLCCSASLAAEWAPDPVFPPKGKQCRSYRQEMSHPHSAEAFSCSSKQTPPLGSTAPPTPSREVLVLDLREGKTLSHQFQFVSFDLKNQRALDRLNRDHQLFLFVLQ